MNKVNNNMKSFLILFLLAVAPLTAMALTNAQPADSDDLQSIVMIQTEGRDQDGSDVPAYCNATFVHPLVLATAAHCVRDAFVIRDFSVNIEVGKYKYVTRPDGTVVRVGYGAILNESKPAQFIFTNALRARINSQGLRTQIGPQEDVALIVLASAMNLPATVKMIPMISQKELQGLAGIVNQYLPTVITINPFAEVTTSNTKRFAALNKTKWNASGFFESTSTSRVEEGDSGAPLLVKIGTTWKLVAAVKGRGQSGFSNWDAYSAFDKKACDMANQLTNAEARAAICP